MYILYDGMQLCIDADWKIGSGGPGGVGGISLWGVEDYLEY